MPRKQNFTVTGRYLDEKPPLAVKQMRSPFEGTPPGREAIARLAFHGPTPKLDWSPAELGQKIAVAAQPDALLLLDTNVFTRELDPVIWDAFRTKHVLITSSVFAELKPWLSNPFHNRSMRDDVMTQLRNQIESAKTGVLHGGNKGVEVLLSDQNDAYLAHGYQYYFGLLSLRKFMGPFSWRTLTKSLGRNPTEEEWAGFVQRHFGSRGLLLARKGLDSLKPPNGVTDENLVLIAVLTAITRGVEVFIITRDSDVMEQYFKLLCLMKEHYRAMCIAARYAGDPASVPFVTTRVMRDEVHDPGFSDEYVMQLVTTDEQFNPLPPKFNFVNIYCVLMGGDPSTPKITWCNFCAETEMAEILKMKVATNGLNTDKFGGRNCTIRTEPFMPHNHRVVVTIANEPARQFGPFGTFHLSDINNALCENELHTKLLYQSGDERHRGH